MSPECHVKCTFMCSSLLEIGQKFVLCFSSMVVRGKDVSVGVNINCQCHMRRHECVLQKLIQKLSAGSIAMAVQLQFASCCMQP